MARFPPQPSVLTTVKMTRTAYAQLQGQKFFPPKIFGRWQEPEGTPERRWRDVGMKLAQARKDSLLRNDDYNKYVDNLKATGYFRNELEGSALWQQLEAKAIDAFLAARRDDDATRPSFASEFNIALSHPKDVAVVAREEDSDSWLDIDATDFDTMLETTMGPKTRQKKATMDVDEDVYATEEERVTQQQTSKLQEMAKKVEEFVEGKGDLDGARFQDEDISDDSNSDEDMESLDDESDEMDDGDSSASPESELLARKEAMEKLVPSLEPSEYGKMPSSYHINSQRVADPTVQPDDDEEAMDHNDAVVASPSTSSAKPEKRIRPPIIPRDQYDGVDSDDETDEEGEEYVDSDSEEEMPQVVGEVEIDMEEEQEEFLEFARHALGMSDEQWASIVQERRERGVFVPPTSGLRDENVDAARSDKGEPQQQHTSHPRPSPNPNLDSFEAVMEALDAEFGRLKPDKSKSREATSASDKGKGKATEAASDSEHDIEAAMDTELRGLIQGEDEDGGEDDVGSADYLDYGLIKNFLESFKSQSGLAGPVGNLVGRSSLSLPTSLSFNMRSPVLAFSILAATVSPSLIAAAPTRNVGLSHRQIARQVPNLPVSAPNGVPSPPGVGAVKEVSSSTQSSNPRQQAKSNRPNNKSNHKEDRGPKPAHVDKRAYDGYTAGGNAHSGGSAPASGGNIANISEDPDVTQINNASNAAGDGSVSATGDGIGGSGDGFGPGGNGSSGNSGPSRGGDIINEGRGGIANTGPGANTVGTGGFSGSGDAIGGSAGGFRKRSYDGYTGGDIGPEVVTGGEGGATSESFTGEAVGGNGDGYGPGGNAYSGPSGPSNGGFVFNEGGDITNTASNAAPNGGVSDSGPAIGGNANGSGFQRRSLRQRAYNDYTAGGNAVSGNSGSVDGGNVINEAGPDDDITNTGGNAAGDAGPSFSGEAVGGNGLGRGPGGNAYSGYTGSTRGGDVINEAGTVENTAGANTGGAGNMNISGDAIGGDADGFSALEGDGVDNFDDARTQ
ncbi:hypothetical protein EUX98_g1866 [Antrodiella citrinella]|uniref:Uncharacterized protein n=1 Tax=Antrodiella citrinella TaxID=2447956 RepID=A0A4S4N0F7_9APHY|nr:hypothetical protein EUX98_g1866 [Antrodiella citrinella]